ncbi:hypothetical protein OS493_012905 [Desmophyllum pertusum]|uniref:Uncharacterized protein n=1 Tax=Desmophyllum pertusum TaxID=174260 RepID=A0A9W9Z4R6_9CNID|nr:hypothetical protein OS493_012905 [Desmophyllum pertusum]
MFRIPNIKDEEEAKAEAEVNMARAESSESQETKENIKDIFDPEQETHRSSATQTEAFDHLYRSVPASSQDTSPHADASSQTDEFDYMFNEPSTSKPFDRDYFRGDDAKVSFYTGLPGAFPLD